MIRKAAIKVILVTLPLPYTLLILPHHFIFNLCDPLLVLAPYSTLFHMILKVVDKLAYKTGKWVFKTSIDYLFEVALFFRSLSHNPSEEYLNKIKKKFQLYRKEQYLSRG